MLSTLLLLLLLLDTDLKILDFTKRKCTKYWLLNKKNVHIFAEMCRDAYMCIHVHTCFNQDKLHIFRSLSICCYGYQLLSTVISYFQCTLSSIKISYIISFLYRHIILEVTFWHYLYFKIKNVSNWGCIDICGVAVHPLTNIDYCKSTKPG